MKKTLGRIMYEVRPHMLGCVPITWENLHDDFKKLAEVRAKAVERAVLRRL